MISAHVLKMIDDEVLWGRIRREWEEKTKIALREIANEINKKYDCDIEYYELDGISEINRKTPYYNERLNAYNEPLWMLMASFNR